MTVEEQIARLTTLSSADLRETWTRLTASPVPRISPSLLRLALAYEIQARAIGGLSRETTRKLDQLAAAKTKTSAVSPGMRLVREWGGKAHVVTIGDDKVIRWNEREWQSLSEVAREITGTRWSGPAFFGLKRKLAA
ncbi:DUF2924 domain-containing protein [Sphingomonas sp. PWP1-2]|uniref:DUF2924 domain-containing protein n=1 Tax=Sphingomonas sp. PWP1-2 TaxID=2804558 RepID=UPI003CF9B1DF